MFISSLTGIKCKFYPLIPLRNAFDLDWKKNEDLSECSGAEVLRSYRRYFSSD